MTAATVGPETLTTSAEVRERIAAIEREAADLPAQIDAALDAGDTLTAQRLQYQRPRALEHEIAALRQQLATLDAQEQAAREAAAAEWRRRALAGEESADAAECTQLWSQIDALTETAARHRTRVERIAELKWPGDPERQRQEIAARCGGTLLQLVGETLGCWLGRDPRVQWDVDILDRISGAQGDALRRLRQHFVAGLGRAP